jgi:hypothetical protein
MLLIEVAPGFEGLEVRRRAVIAVTITTSALA